jgi:hypothetical protein
LFAVYAFKQCSSVKAKDNAWRTEDEESRLAVSPKNDLSSEYAQTANGRQGQVTPEPRAAPGVSF